jgi:hypothetical protein
LPTPPQKPFWLISMGTVFFDSWPITDADGQSDDECTAQMLGIRLFNAALR